MFTRAFARATIVAAVAATAGLVGCASAGGGRSSGPPNPVQLEIRNNLALPSDLTVYAVTRGGSRTLLGDVPPATTRTFTFKPVSFSERYHLEGIRQLKRPVRSQYFSVGDDMTGRIVWTIVPNIVGFEEIDTDSTATDTTHTP
jgi:hypothetical protein